MTATAATKQKHLAPINVMTIDTENTPINDHPELGVVARIYAKYTNAHGGIAGHQLHVTVCNDQNTATQAAICAEQAVSNKDVAVVSSISLVGDSAIIPILQQANISWFGDPVAAFPGDLTSPVSFSPTLISTQNGAEVALAFQNGCKKVSVIVNAGGSATVLTPVFEAAAKAYGATINQIVSVDPTAGDFTAYVTQALQGGTDCVATALGTSEFASLLPPWAASGTKAVLYTGGGQLTPGVCASFVQVCNGSYNVSTFLDISAPAYAPFRVALAKYDAPSGPSYSYDSVQGAGAWAGWVLFGNIAATIKGSITGSSFLKAVRHTTAGSSDGLLPLVDFAKPWNNGPSGVTQAFNCGVTYQQLENGQYTQSQQRFQNANALLLGTGKLGPRLLATSTALACRS
jgi:ABC-type branched-subunit amino acid transport system substrate-binding protein